MNPKNSKKSHFTNQHLVFLSKKSRGGFHFGSFSGKRDQFWTCENFIKINSQLSWSKQRSPWALMRLPIGTRPETLLKTAPLSNALRAAHSLLFLFSSLKMFSNGEIYLLIINCPLIIMMWLLIIIMWHQAFSLNPNFNTLLAADKMDTVDVSLWWQRLCWLITL